jgi:hypothetical protein
VVIKDSMDRINLRGIVSSRVPNRSQEVGRPLW